MGIYCYSDFIQRNCQQLCTIKLLTNTNDEVTTYREAGDISEASDGCTEKNSTFYENEDDSRYNEYYYEEESPSGRINEAIIVLVPQKTIKWNENRHAELQEILKWDLSKFKDFDTYHSQYYDTDEWEFGDIASYRDVILHRKDDNSKSVWQSCRFKGFWLVNFEPVSYQAFVRKTIDPNLIPWYYYIEVLTQEKIRGKSKKEAFEMILTLKR